MKTKKLFSMIAILVLLLAALPVLSVGAAVCTITLNPGGDIQAAIGGASSGDVICLNPGVYSPTAKININQSVTLQGPQAGVDPRPSAGSTRVPGDSSTEAIIDGAAGGLSGIIVITADNVVLDGLEVRNGSGDLVDSESSIPTIGTILRYNIINNATGDEGMQIRNTTDGLIEYNYLFDIAQDGINMCCGSTGGLIQHNEVHDNYSENAAIYIYDATEMTVSCNLVYNVFDNDGIKLGAKGGGDAALSGGNILYNTVHDTAQDGITVYTSDTRVEGNRVYNSSSENGAIYVAWAVSNVTIVSNEVHDNTLDTGKWVDPGAVMIGSAVDAATVTVNDNNIYGNVVNGVTNKAVALLDAVNNWWGDAAGPGSGDTVSANVDFDPWLSEPVVISDPCVPNEPPDCSAAQPSVALIWPPNHKFVPVDVLGVTDPDGEPVLITIDSIFQDEPVDTFGDGSFTPDGQGVGSSTAEVRAERAGTKKVPGNGRVYHISFTADDGNGGSCSDEVLVGVPHDQGKGNFPIDDGPLYDSTTP